MRQRESRQARTVFGEAATIIQGLAEGIRDETLRSRFLAGPQIHPVLQHAQRLATSLPDDHTEPSGLSFLTFNASVVTRAAQGLRWLFVFPSRTNLKMSWSCALWRRVKTLVLSATPVAPVMNTLRRVHQPNSSAGHSERSPGDDHRGRGRRPGSRSPNRRVG